MFENESYVKQNIKNIIQSQVLQIKIFKAATTIYYFCLLILDNYVTIQHAFSKKIVSFMLAIVCR